MSRCCNIQTTKGLRTVVMWLVYGVFITASIHTVVAARGYRLQVTSYRLQVTGCGLQVTPGCSTGVENFGDSVIRIKQTTDFSISGDGSASGWSNASWTDLTIQEGSSALPTRVKMLYSQRGVYFLFECADEKLTATIMEDNRGLFREDVVEVFLWPDQSVPIYFEYELSPLNYELFIMVPNINGKFQGWKPWHYEGDKRVKHATAVKGEKKSNAAIDAWTAEFFIPFDLLRPMVSGLPQAGTAWRGNFYRIDYDHGYTTWSWQKTTKGVDGNFHEFRKFGRIVFE